MRRSRTNPALLAHLLLLAVVVVWGTTFSLVKAALAATTPLVFNLLRMSLAFAVLVLVNRRGLRGITRPEMGLGAVAGVFLALGYQLQTSGLAHTTAAKAAFITGLVVVLVPLLGTVPGISSAGSSRLTIDILAGALLAFAGLVLLTSPSGARASVAELFSGFGPGELLCLGCAVAFAAHLLTLAHAAPRISALRLGTLQIGFAALTMLITLPLGGRAFLRPSPVLWIALSVTAIFATAAAFTIQSWAQQHLPASHTALILTLEPVFAWLTSLLFFGEQLSARALLGAALILAGIVLSELRPTQRYGRSREHGKLLTAEPRAESIDPPFRT